MIGIDRRLVDREPNSKDRHRRLKDDLTKLANLLLEISDPAAARDAYGEAFVAIERWLDIARDNFMKTSNDANRNDLVQAYGDAGWNALFAGRASRGAAAPRGGAIAQPRYALEHGQSRPRLSVPGALRGGDAALCLGQERDRSEDGKRTYGRDIRDDFALFRRLGLTRPRWRAPNASSSSERFLIEHDLIRKPVRTFRDHATAGVNVIATPLMQ